ncbi:MAG: hypothetical protein ACREL1_01130, partial [bacterium]
VVYAATPSDVFAVDANNGKIFWRTKVAGDIGSLTKEGDILYAFDKHGRGVCAIDCK